MEWVNVLKITFFIRVHQTAQTKKNEQIRGYKDVDFCRKDLSFHSEI